MAAAWKSRAGTRSGGMVAASASSSGSSRSVSNCAAVSRHDGGAPGGDHAVASMSAASATRLVAEVVEAIVASLPRARSGFGAPDRAAVRLVRRYGWPMLFPRRLWAGLADGTVTLAYRRWRRPAARAGSVHRTPAGLLRIEAVEPVALEDISEADARRAGFGDLAALRAEQARHGGDGRLYRIELRPAGPDPRLALREQAELSPDELAGVLARLEGMDARSGHGPWTAATLRAIAAAPGHPRRRAGHGARARAGAVQGRRAQAQGARAHREPRARLPSLASRPDRVGAPGGVRRARCGRPHLNSRASPLMSPGPAADT